MSCQMIWRAALHSEKKNSDLDLDLELDLVVHSISGI